MYGLPCAVVRPSKTVAGLHNPARSPHLLLFVKNSVQSHSTFFRGWVESKSVAALTPTPLVHPHQGREEETCTPTKGEKARERARERESKREQESKRARDQETCNTTKGESESERARERESERSRERERERGAGTALRRSSLSSSHTRYLSTLSLSVFSLCVLPGPCCVMPC